MESLQQCLNPSIAGVEMTKAERDSHIKAAKAYLEHMSNLAKQHEHYVDQAYRENEAKKCREKMKELKQKADDRCDVAHAHRRETEALNG